MTGIVKWFNSSQGYGFITASDGKDVFVHHTSIEDTGYRTLSEGDKVTFDLYETDSERYHAHNVKKAER